MMISKIASTLTTALVVVALSSTNAAAHTPTVGASCDALEVFAQGSNYSASDTNTLTVSLDGVSDSVEFDTDGRLVMPIPEDGQPHEWSASVETTNDNPNYSTSDSGTITCGEPEEPAKKRAWISIRKIDPCGWKRDDVWVDKQRRVQSVKVDRVTRNGWRVTAVAQEGAVFKNGTELRKVFRRTTNSQKGCHQTS